MKLKTIAAATLLSVSAFAAQAVPLDALAGNYNWKLQGTTTEFSGPYTVPNGPYGAGSLVETTWGVGEITQINDNNGDPAWTGGLSDGTRLYYMIYGIADLSVIGAGPVDIYNIGCTGGLGCDGKIHIDIYRTGIGGSVPGILAQDPHDRIAFDGFSGVTDAFGPAYLKLELVPGKVVVNDPSTAAIDETTATLKQVADLSTLPTSGDGTFFAEVVGGTGALKWNTDGFLGGAADFDGIFTLRPNTAAFGGTCTNAEVAANTCFPGLINDPVQSVAVIPEPGSLALLAGALFGMAGLRRRKA